MLIHRRVCRLRCIAFAFDFAIYSTLHSEYIHGNISSIMLYLISNLSLSSDARFLQFWRNPPEKEISAPANKRKIIPMITQLIIDKQEKKSPL